MKKKWLKKYGKLVSWERKEDGLLFLHGYYLLAVLNITLPQANTQKNEMAANLESTSPSQQAKKVADKEFPATSGTPPC